MRVHHFCNKEALSAHRSKDYRPQYTKQGLNTEQY